MVRGVSEGRAERWQGHAGNGPPVPACPLPARHTPEDRQCQGQPAVVISDWGDIRQHTRGLSTNIYNNYQGNFHIF